MRTTTLVAALAISTALAAPGYAAVFPDQCGTDPTCSYNPTTGISSYDPTDLHVASSTSSSSDPILLNTNQAFSIQDTSQSNINPPLTIYIAVPHGDAVPVINTVTYTLGTTTSNVTGLTLPLLGTFVVNDPSTGTGSTDLYAAVGKPQPGNSISFANINPAENADGIATPSSFSLDIYSFSIPQGFVGKDEVNVTGTFSDGSIVFPYAEDDSQKSNGKVTVYDTSWTNAGFVDCNESTSQCSKTTPPPPPPPDPVPEPSGLLVLGVGLLGLGYTVARRRS
jgi:hypothetical protein